MNHDNDNGFRCVYSNHSEGESYVLLHFNSIQAAKKAAFELLSFLGDPIPQTAEPQESPPHKISEEVTATADPLTAIQKEAVCFADTLRIYRNTHGYSQRKMAELLGTSQSNICWWEKGEYTPNEDTRRTILKKLESGDFSA